MRAKRSKNKILQEILSICSKGENITRIAYRSNTNITVARKHVESLKEKKLVDEIKGSPVIYKTNDRGLQVMDRLKMLQNEMDGLIAK